MINRMEEVRKNAFLSENDSWTPTEREHLDFAKMAIGAKKFDDPIILLSDFEKMDSNLGSRQNITTALAKGDLATLRDISSFFYRTSGIYNRLCRYMAYMYRYDWLVTPYINDFKGSNDELLKGFYKVLKYFDDFEIKKFFGEVALKVIRNGCYYGYLVSQDDRVAVQELPIAFCRSRFVVEGRPLVEFDMRYFDVAFKNTTVRNQILKVFPEEFAKGYRLYKLGKLAGEAGDRNSGWYPLDPKKSIKFNINGEDFPMFASVIPSIIDLSAAQALDKKKMEQQLLKIIIQKMPLDKNGDLVFDLDEAREIHNNAVRMLQKAIGIDVLTTFADVEVADTSDRSAHASYDELSKTERTVYNEAGVSQMQFNTDGNLALEKSILNDEASLYNLIQQFESFLNFLLKDFNKKPKKLYFKAQLLTTTIYNYKELAKLYKEQTQLGYSKMLPQIAMGQSQSSILANAYFENDILDLVNVFVPPMMSSTMNAAALGKEEDDKKGGRPEKQDDEKSEKTIQNKESMS